MNWLSIVERGGMVITFVLIILLIKEFKKSFKQSSEGKVSGRCELD